MWPPESRLLSPWPPGRELQCRNRMMERAMAWLRRDNNALIMPRVASCGSSGGSGCRTQRGPPARSAVLLLEPGQDLRPGTLARLRFGVRLARPGLRVHRRRIRHVAVGPDQEARLELVGVQSDAVPG